MQLFERQSSLAALNDRLDDAAAGSGGVVLVCGEAGIGKSALIECWRGDIRHRARMLVGACDPLSTPRPLGPVADIAAQVGGDLARCMNGRTSRDQVFQALLKELTAPQSLPTVAIFEDVHWADDATLDLLRYLGRRLAGTTSLLVVTFRDDEVGPRHPLRVVIGDLASVARPLRISLEPLGIESIRLLADDERIDPTALHQITGGNPFFVTEVLAVGAAELPESVRDAVLARAARLPTHAREVLDAAAVLSAPIEPAVLGDVACADAEAIETCLSSGMLRAAGNSLEFRHDLSRQAVLAAIPQPRLRRLHTSALRVLSAAEASNSDLAGLAHHAECAQDREAVLRFAPAAAQQAAAVRSHRAAADQFRRALRFADHCPPDTRAQLFESLAYECYLTDQIEDAVGARQAALALWREAGEPLHVGDNHRWLSRLWWFRSRRANAESEALAAVDVLEPHGPTVQLARAYSNLAHLAMLADDVSSTVAWGDRAVALAQEVGDEETVIHARNNVGSALMLKGDDNGRAFLEESLRRALELGQEEHAARAWTNLVSASVRLYEFDQAKTYLADGLSYCQDHDLDSWVRYKLGWQATMLCALGEWNAAVASANQVLQAPSAAAVSRIMPLVTIGLIRARRGDPDVWAPLDEARALAGQAAEGQRMCPVALARIEAAWLEGNEAQTAVEFAAAIELRALMSDPWTRGELWHWSYVLGCPVEPNGELAPPLALERAGDYAAAADSWSSLGCTYAAARTLAMGDVRSQRAAIATLDSIGARRLAGMVGRRLRDQGVANLPRGPRPSSRSNPAGLTNREVLILRHLLRDRTNREIADDLFVSAKTVESHITSIFSKLGVKSRPEAVRAGLAIGLEPL